MRVTKNATGSWAYDKGSMFMEASCHHRKSARGHSACGGCYARAVEVLKALADGGAPLAQEFIKAVQEEAKR